MIGSWSNFKACRICLGQAGGWVFASDVCNRLCSFSISWLSETVLLEESVDLLGAPEVVVYLSRLCSANGGELDYYDKLARGKRRDIRVWPYSSHCSAWSSPWSCSRPLQLAHKLPSSCTLRCNLASTDSGRWRCWHRRR